MSKPSRTREVILALLVLYVLSYVAAYSFRPPGASANLAYFAYTGPAVSGSVEYGIYYFYYPIYKAHHLLGGQRHTYDRPDLVYPEEAL